MKSSVTLALIFRFKHPGLKKVHIYCCKYWRVGQSNSIIASSMLQVCSSDKHQQPLYFVNPVIQLLTPVFFIFSGTWKYYGPKKRYLAWLWTGLTTLNLSWLWRYFELQSSKETKFVCKNLISVFSYLPYFSKFWLYLQTWYSISRTKTKIGAK